MIAVALAAIVLNVLIGVWLYSGSQDKLNIRSAYLHMMGDAVAALGVVVAGVVLLMTGTTWVDPAISLSTPS